MAEFTNLRVNRAQVFFISRIFQDGCNPTRNRFHFSLAHSASGESRSTYAYAAGHKRRPLLVWNRVFIDGDASFVERSFGHFAGDVFCR